MQIALRQFAAKEIWQSYGDTEQSICISSQQLCQFLSSAETRQRVRTQQTGVVNGIDPGILKRRRPQTPSGHASSKDQRHLNKRIRDNKAVSIARAPRLVTQRHRAYNERVPRDGED